ncbi:cupin domain-containing protein [Salinigranum sp.]|uniref:cupin domain-containing protein n=1 Tax=Salinigranum sp. TaxID=1966351 RepID=UPI0035680AF2
MTGTPSGPGSVERGSFDGSGGTTRPFERDGEPDVVRLRLDAGESVAPHSHPERRVVFFVVEGRFEVRLDDDSYPVGAGDCLRFDGDAEISPRATEDGPATALVVLARTRT